MRLLGRIFFWLLAIVGGTTLLFVGLGIWAAHRNQTPPLPKRMVLSLDFNQPLQEAESTSPFTNFGRHKGYLVKDIIETLDQASRDPRVDGIVAHIDAPALGMARTQELRDAVLAFRKSGKEAVVYATSLGGDGSSGTLAYYLAASFKEIWLQPSGDVNLTGYEIQSPFFKGTFDLLGIKAEFGARHEYKSAIETFTHDHFSKEAREPLQLLLDSWTRQTIEGIAGDRSLKPEQVKAAIDQGPLLADEALRDKLVDKLAYWDELDQSLRAKNADIIDLNRYAASVKPEPTALKVALIAGIGEVKSGEDDPFADQQAMTSGRICQALRDAAKDPTVKAILFRIDSPGGSYVASDLIWRAVGKARESGKPVVVSMGNMAASGGYFAAMAADRIVAEPGTITGSIGVFSGKFVAADLFKRLGVTWDELHTGQNVGMDSITTDFTPAQWQRLNNTLDHIYADFTGKAEQGRHLKPEEMDKLARGRVWPGEDAKRLGLVDAMGGYQEAFVQIRQLAKLPSQMPIHLVTFPHPKSPLELFIDMAKSGQVPENVSADIGALGQLTKLAKIAEPLTRILSTSEGQGRLQMAPIEVK